MRSSRDLSSRFLCQILLDEDALCAEYLPMVRDEDEDKITANDVDDDEQIADGYEIEDDGTLTFLLAGEAVGREDYLAARVGEIADALGMLTNLALDVGEKLSTLKATEHAVAAAQQTPGSMPRQAAVSEEPQADAGMFGLGGKENG